MNKMMTSGQYAWNLEITYSFELVILLIEVYPQRKINTYTEINEMEVTVTF